ncbi:MAG: hypothetical protein AAF485_13745 [Chloroflexota bacterium]
MTSQDGSNWFLARKIVDDITINIDGWYGVAFGNDTYVAVGGSIWIRDHEPVALSNDGDRWTTRKTDPPSQPNGRSRLQAVTFAAGSFVAVGANASIKISEEGQFWESLRVPTTQDLNDVAYGNGLFVAVGNGGTILTSKAPIIDEPAPLSLDIHQAIELEMVTTPGANYRIEHSDDGGASWSRLEVFTADSTHSYRCYSAREPTHRLYRYVQDSK